MKTKKNSLLLTVLISVLTILSTVNPVSAGSVIGLDEITKDVPIGGTVDFTVTLQTTNTGPGVMAWRVNPMNQPITAELDNKGLSKFGFVSINTPPSPKTFTLTVAAGNGAVVGHEYLVELNYCTGTEPCEGNTAIARAQAGVIPTPELSPSILTAVGLIGLIGLVRMRRKD